MSRHRKGVTELPCGCLYTDEPSRWLFFCVEHGMEIKAIRERWAADRLDVVQHDMARTSDVGDLAWLQD